MKLVLVVLWQIALVPAVGCSTFVLTFALPLLAFGFLVIIYQISF